MDSDGCQMTWRREWKSRHVSRTVSSIIPIHGVSTFRYTSYVISCSSFHAPWNPVGWLPIYVALSQLRLLAPRGSGEMENVSTNASDSSMYKLGMAFGWPILNFFSEDSSCIMGTTLTIKKTGTLCEVVSSMLETISSTYPPQLNWEANSECSNASGRPQRVNRMGRLQVVHRTSKPWYSDFISRYTFQAM